MKKQKMIVLLIFAICFGIFIASWFLQGQTNARSDGIIKPNIILESKNEIISSIKKNKYESNSNNQMDILAYPI